ETQQERRENPVQAGLRIKPDKDRAHVKRIHINQADGNIVETPNTGRPLPDIEVPDALGPARNPLTSQDARYPAAATRCRPITTQATIHAGYPNSFLAPIASNEPGLSSGLAVIESILAQLSAADISPERTILLGFSQGACLTLEYVARHAQRYGGVVGLSG